MIVYTQTMIQNVKNPPEMSIVECHPDIKILEFKKLYLEILKQTDDYKEKIVVHDERQKTAIVDYFHNLLNSEESMIISNIVISYLGYFG